MKLNKTRRQNIFYNAIINIFEKKKNEKNQ